MKRAIARTGLISGVIALSLAALAALATPAAAQAQAAAKASADPDGNSNPRSAYGFGMRVGGYGFRNPQATSITDKWNDCRMNGLGVFGQRELAHDAFIEAGSDIYFADNFVLGADESLASSMDRLSGLLSVAVGVRMYPSSRISAFVQLGAGIELTRVVLSSVRGSEGDTTRASGTESMHSAVQETDNAAMPLGFLGFGADLRLGGRARLGVNLRTYVMAHYDHGDHGDHADHGEGAEVLNAQPEAANQVQFYLRYTL